MPGTLSCLADRAKGLPEWDLGNIGENGAEIKLLLSGAGTERFVGIPGAF